MTGLDDLSDDALAELFEIVLLLRVVRDCRLYRRDFATFEDYCAARWSDLGLDDVDYLNWLLG